MFYIEKTVGDYVKAALGTDEFENILRKYVVDISELTTSQYRDFKGILIVLDLYTVLYPNNLSSYVVRFSPDE